ncbi:hypothetical protein CORC01_00426 [Colletotrichum orchidophilum]|uniref:Uncharacterized protein n=1 Tax=Colletotrichum orchidophilum TaxID=1209926 RepID=A0A1G4BS52_9PEZI|nr:uncharacterized protein CORC01_00426 [Colletotrichum orchidophilum]OHF04087.1 hypothetical protein CORC01_00426 [Colletotrichum orchidophilum]
MAGKLKISHEDKTLRDGYSDKAVKAGIVSAKEEVVVSLGDRMLKANTMPIKKEVIVPLWDHGSRQALFR